MPTGKNIISRREFLKNAGLAFGGISIISLLGACSSKVETLTKTDTITKFATVTDTLTTTVTVQQSTVNITDFVGNVVTVPADPQHIGALYGGAFPQILFLGGADRVALKFSKDNAWTKEICPELDSYDTEYYSNARDPNVEELVALGVDVVFYWGDLPTQVESMNNVGIPVVISNSTITEFSTTEEWLDLIEREVMMYADVLGQNAVTKAEKWLDYVKEKVDYVSQKTANLTGDDIKRVYFNRSSTDCLECFAQDSYPLITVQIAGGRLVSDGVETTRGFTTVTMEQVAEWDPEYIFAGWVDSTSYITENEQWAEITAAKNGNVYMTPCSLTSTCWDYTAESPLSIMYLAKTIHPELFEDLDIIAEIQYFYKTFYNYDLSAEGAQNMLNRLGLVDS